MIHQQQCHTHLLNHTSETWLSQTECWGGWSKESLEEWGLLAKLSTAGMMSTMGQWWSMEIAAGMAGVLGTISLAAHSCISNLLFFVFPFACADHPFLASTLPRLANPTRTFHRLGKRRLVEYPSRSMMN